MKEDKRKNMKTVYFDLLCGASGDMILGSLIDLGLPVDYLSARMNSLGIDQLSIRAEKVKRSGMTATRMVLDWAEQRRFRGLHSILDLIRQGQFSDSVYSRCETVLRRIAEAEAKVHGVEIEKVHFHEVGAVDTIVDVLGACLGFEYLGIDRIAFSTLTVGHGTIRGEHGIMPAPCPATATMARGYVVEITEIPAEILTPTGCALLTALGEQQTEGISGSIEAIGYGSGTREISERPNLLRAMILAQKEQTAGGDVVCLLETDLDSVTGEQMGFAAERLFEAGALDVSWIPLFMKKNRPGYRLSVIAPPGVREKVIRAIVTHTRTLGVRYSRVQRARAGRVGATRMFEGMELAEKSCRFEDVNFTKPEYESLAALARSRGESLFSLLEKYYRGT